MQINLNPEDIACLLKAIKDAQDELCVGKGFPEGTAYYNHLQRIADYFNTLQPLPHRTTAPSA